MVDALLARGPGRFRVKAVTRSPDAAAARALAARGVEVVQVGGGRPAMYMPQLRRRRCSGADDPLTVD